MTRHCLLAFVFLLNLGLQLSTRIYYFPTLLVNTAWDVGVKDVSAKTSLKKPTIVRTPYNGSIVRHVRCMYCNSKKDV